jgi:hypothetical protein
VFDYHIQAKNSNIRMYYGLTFQHILYFHMDQHIYQLMEVVAVNMVEVGKTVVMGAELEVVGVVEV